MAVEKDSSATPKEHNFRWLLLVIYGTRACVSRSFVSALFVVSASQWYVILAGKRMKDGRNACGDGRKVIKTLPTRDAQT